MSNQTADVATVLALEEPAKALQAAIEAAKPALERLDAAGYAGLDYVITEVDQIREAGGGDREGLHELISVLGIFRAAEGNWGAFDYRYFVVHSGQTVGQAARDILDMNDDDAHMQRVELLRHYAAAGVGT
jgi:hypothetical protein